MQAGDTFLLPGRDDHLWAVISDPTIDAKRVVVVMFVSWQEHYDQACLLDVGDHPFIKHRTCVQYQAAKVVADARMEELRHAGQLRPKAPLNAEVLARIRGAAENADIPTGVYEVLREQRWVP